MNIYLSFHIFLAHIVNPIDFIKKILYNIYIKEKKQTFNRKALTMLIWNYAVELSNLFKKCKEMNILS